MNDCAVSSPAKVNFFLAVTGRRADGFHDLVSVAAQLELADTVRLERGRGDADSLACDMPGVPTDGTNIVLRAARAWREAGGEAAPIRFVLEKKVPPQSGLGGGSSNAVAALRGLERVAEKPVGADRIRSIAVSLGSDCALFFENGPVIMRGRGERIEVLPEVFSARLRGGELLLCRPGIGVDTAWAYGQLVRRAPASYLPASDAESRLAGWLAGGENDALSFNSFEAPVWEKFVVLPVLGRRLEARHGLRLRLSGSGSACFAWLLPGTDRAQAVADVRDALGSYGLVTTTRIAAAAPHGG